MTSNYLRVVWAEYLCRLYEKRENALKDYRWPFTLQPVGSSVTLGGSSSGGTGGPFLPQAVRPRISNAMSI